MQRQRYNQQKRRLSAANKEAEEAEAKNVAAEEKKELLLMLPMSRTSASEMRQADVILFVQVLCLFLAADGFC